MRKIVTGLTFCATLAGLSPVWALSVSPTNDANTLANSILGSGVSLIGSPTYTGAAAASGIFSEGMPQVSVLIKALF
jgi:hypothetical protein